MGYVPPHPCCGLCCVPVPLCLSPALLLRHLVSLPSCFHSAPPLSDLPQRWAAACLPRPLGLSPFALYQGGQLEGVARPRVLNGSSLCFWRLLCAIPRCPHACALRGWSLPPLSLRSPPLGPSSRLLLSLPIFPFSPPVLRVCVPVLGQSAARACGLRPRCGAQCPWAPLLSPLAASSSSCPGALGWSSLLFPPLPGSPGGGVVPLSSCCCCCAN